MGFIDAGVAVAGAAAGVLVAVTDIGEYTTDDEVDYSEAKVPVAVLLVGSVPVRKEQEPLLAGGNEQQEGPQKKDEVHPAVFRIGVVLGVISVA